MFPSFPQTLSCLLIRILWREHQTNDDDETSKSNGIEDIFGSITFVGRWWRSSRWSTGFGALRKGTGIGGCRRRRCVRGRWRAAGIDKLLDVTGASEVEQWRGTQRGSNNTETWAWCVGPRIIQGEPPSVDVAKDGTSNLIPVGLSIGNTSDG